jgi:hypothetical protein
MERIMYVGNVWNVREYTYDRNVRKCTYDRNVRKCTYDRNVRERMHVLGVGNTNLKWLERMNVRR